MNSDDGLVEQLEAGGDWRRFPSRLAKELRKQIPLSKHSRILFTGPASSGKILAAQVLAGDRGLDLYRIDLAKVVSKYIGETEKNLTRLIAGVADLTPAALVFSAAEALVEVHLTNTDLLRKLERFPGPVIVAGDVAPPEALAAQASGVTGIVAFNRPSRRPRPA